MQIESADFLHQHHLRFKREAKCFVLATFLSLHCLYSREKLSSNFKSTDKSQPVSVNNTEEQCRTFNETRINNFSLSVEFNIVYAFKSKL